MLACGGEFVITDDDPVVDLFYAPGATYATNALCQWVVRGRPGRKLEVKPIFTNTGKLFCLFSSCWFAFCLLL